MYINHFGLTEEPFSIAANPRFLYMSASHREALGHLLYGIGSDSGFVLLTGEVGTGKTTVCRCLLQQLPDNTDVAYILNPKVSVTEMLGSICDELEIDYGGVDSSIKCLVDAINAHLLRRHADGRQTVVIIDEAQNLSFDVLEQLRLLTNLETDERKLVRIILIGQPELADMLAKPAFKQVEQRITARYRLQPLQRSEIGAYVSHRLAVAGRRKVIFPPSILPRLYTKTRGIPRLINVICDRAMLGAYVNSKSKVNAKILTEAAQEVQGRSSRSGWVIPVGLLASILLVGGATATAYFYDNPARLAGLLMPPSSVTFVEGQKPESIAPVFEVTSKPAAKTDWPDGIEAVDNNLTAAYQSLFGEWGLDMSDDQNKPCDQARNVGLRCFSGVGNLGSLMATDRPAILTLLDTNGNQYHATLLRVSDSQADIAFKHGVETVSVDELEARWRGEYRIMWRTSPQGYSIVRPGRRGQDVTWLTTRLISAGVDSIKVQPEYDAGVVDAVKTFQRNSGLAADGIAGRNTLIRLSSLTDNSVPRLTGRAGS